MSKTDDRLRKLLAQRQKRESPAAEGVKPKRKKKTEAFAVDISKIEEMSESELVALAHEVGYESASRQLPREELIDLILGTSENVPIDPVQWIREKTWKYVEGNKSIMPSSMPCDLNCLACPSRIVVECHAVNHDLIEEME